MTDLIGSRTRLSRPEATTTERTRQAAAVVALLIAAVVLGLALTPLLFVAAGAGAGYSLSGSV